MLPCKTSVIFNMPPKQKPSKRTLQDRNLDLQSQRVVAKPKTSTAPHLEVNLRRSIPATLAATDASDISGSHSAANTESVPNAKLVLPLRPVVLLLPSPTSLGETDTKLSHTKHSTPVGFRDALRKTIVESGALVSALSLAPNPDYARRGGHLARSVEDLELTVEDEFECVRCMLEELCEEGRVEGFALVIGLKLLGYHAYYRMAFASYERNKPAEEVRIVKAITKYLQKL
jgi:hypothetical protein